MLVGEKCVQKFSPDVLHDSGTWSSPALPLPRLLSVQQHALRHRHRHTGTHTGAHTHGRAHTHTHTHTSVARHTHACCTTQKDHICSRCYSFSLVPTNAHLYHDAGVSYGSLRHACACCTTYIVTQIPMMLLHVHNAQLTQ